MSFAELKNEVDRLSPEERKQLRSYLALKDGISDQDFLKGLEASINDRTPGRWVTLEEFEKHVAR